MTNDPMSPDVVPDALFGGRRPNRVPIYIVGGIVSALLMIVASVAVQRSNAAVAQVGPESEQKAHPMDNIAQTIVGDNLDGVVPPLAVPDIDLDQPPVPIAHADIDDDVDDDFPTTPNIVARDGAASKINSPPGAPAPDSPLENKRMQALEAALSGRISVQGAAQGAGERISEARADLARLQAARAGDPDGSRNFTQRMKALKDMGLIPGSGGGAMQLAAAGGEGGSGGYGQFDLNGKEDRWKLGTEQEAPRSDFELRTGAVIPAVMISGINSDLPGAIVAQVSQAVYDTATGRQLLIPQGSRLVGAYDSGVNFGQERVLIAFQRIIFPDGKALDIGAMPGADDAGYSGARDKANHHYLRTFGSAVLMALITGSIELTQNRNNTSSYGSDRQDASSAMSEALGQQLGQVAAQLVQKNLSVAPTLEIRPGFQFNIVVTKDITLERPYNAFDYKTAANSTSVHQP